MRSPSHTMCVATPHTVCRDVHSFTAASADTNRAVRDSADTIRVLVLFCARFEVDMESSVLGPHFWWIMLKAILCTGIFVHSPFYEHRRELLGLPLPYLVWLAVAGVGLSVEVVAVTQPCISSAFAWLATQQRMQVGMLTAAFLLGSSALVIIMLGAALLVKSLYLKLVAPSSLVVPGVAVQPGRPGRS